MNRPRNTAAMRYRVALGVANALASRPRSYSCWGRMRVCLRRQQCNDNDHEAETQFCRSRFSRVTTYYVHLHSKAV